MWHNRDNSKTSFPKRAAVSAMALLALAVSSSCGNTAFVPNKLCSLQTGPGYYSIAPKIDFVLVTDNTGSMGSALSQLKSRMPQFLEQLEATGWDYRFTNIGLTIPLGSQATPVSQIIPAKVDGNWFSLGLWRPVMPGATPSSPTPVQASLFRTQSSFTGFFDNSSANGSVNSSEQGFHAIYNTLNQSRGETQMIRSNSLVVTLVVGNGNDSTDVTYYEAAPGTWVPSPQSLINSFNTWRNNLRTLANQPSMFKMYSVVSPVERQVCSSIQSSAEAGTRYIDMAAATGGLSYDICTQPIASAISDLSSQLQVTRLAYRTRYVVISQLPINTATIAEVRKTTGCNDAEGTLIPQSATNGWTYAGLIQNQPAITEPTSLNPVSGYAIELHGSARLEGDETLRVIYTREGAQAVQ